MIRRGKHLMEDGRVNGRIRPDVLKMAEQLLAGQLRRAAAARVLAEKFSISERQAYRYVKHAEVQLVSEQDDVERPLRKHAIRASFQDLYQRALKGGRLSTARAALADLARLDGLFDEVKIGHTHSGGSGVLVVSGTTPSAEAWLAEQRGLAEGDE